MSMLPFAPTTLETIMKRLEELQKRVDELEDKLNEPTFTIGDTVNLSGRGKGVINQVFRLRDGTKRYGVVVGQGRYVSYYEAESWELNYVIEIE